MFILDKFLSLVSMQNAILL